MRKRRVILFVKKLSFLLLFILSFGGFVSCSKKQAEPNTPIQDLLVEYPLDNLTAFTVASDGTVYAVNLELSQESTTGNSGYWLHRFDSQGNREESIPLSGYTMVQALALSADEKCVYFTGQGQGSFGLFSCSLEDGTFTLLCSLSHFFYDMEQIAVLGDAVYLLGRSLDWNPEGAPNSGYEFSGERLISLDLSTGDLAQLGFSFPVSLAKGDTTLFVLGYLENIGYCMMEYDPSEDSMQVISELEEYKFDKFAVCNGGKDIVYWDMLRGLVISGLTNLSSEADLLSEGWTSPGVAFAGGNVYCPRVLPNNTLVSFPLDAVQRNNRELTLLVSGYSKHDPPYGCGYRIDPMETAEDMFALKVLARDPDFDLCLGDSWDGSGRNLRDNGSFYPLNDVPGIEEYFSRCFPHVREAATKEDGTIWMLPVDLGVFGLIADKEALEESGIPLRSDMTWGQFLQMMSGTTAEQRENIHMDIVSFFPFQYFSRHDTLNTGQFSESVAAISGLVQLGFSKSNTAMGDIFYSSFSTAFIASSNREAQLFFGMPKIEESDKNSAFCHFLAVNPDSAKRGEALAYIADLVAYLLKRNDFICFADRAILNEYNESLQQVYENAEIAFAIDSDVYSDGLRELLSGELPLEDYIQRNEPKLGKYWGE